MNTYPKGNDLQVRWSLIYSDDTPFPLGSYDYELSYKTNRGSKVVTDTSVITIEDNILIWDFRAFSQSVSGVYSLGLKIFLAGSQVVELNYDNAFCLSALKHVSLSGNVVNLTSVCDVIDVRDAVLQSRKSLDLAASAEKKASASVEVSNDAMAKAKEALGKATTAEEKTRDAESAAQIAQESAQSAAGSMATIQASLDQLSPDQSGALALAGTVNSHGEKLSELEGEVEGLCADVKGAYEQKIIRTDLSHSAWVDGYGVNVSTGATTSSSTSCYAYVRVDGMIGETIHFMNKKRVSASTTGVAFYNSATQISTATFIKGSGRSCVVDASAGTDDYTLDTITVPQGAVICVFTFYLAKKNVFEVYTETMEDVYSPPKIGRFKYGVSLGANKAIKVFCKGYAKDIDLCYTFGRKANNALVDFSGFQRHKNTSLDVLVEPSSEVSTILSSTTDFLSPSILYAVNNADGDFPTKANSYLTGGWHGYMSKTDGSGSATARNVSLNVYVDGIRLSEGDKVRGDSVLIDIVNRLQASNTEKENGSGREVIEQHIQISFDGFRAIVDGEILALEDIDYKVYYGVSTYQMSGKTYHFVGCRTKRGAQTPSSTANRCGDKFCTCVKQYGDNDTFIIGFNPTIDLGTMFANNWTHSFISQSGKTYAVLIHSDSDGSEDSMLRLAEGERVFWQGFYEFQNVYL